MSKIKAFPVTARVHEIRFAAHALCGLHGEAANEFWRQTIKGLRQQLDGSGISPEERDRELRAFSDAVFIRIRETARRAQP